MSSVSRIFCLHGATGRRIPHAIVTVMTKLHTACGGPVKPQAGGVPGLFGPGTHSPVTTVDGQDGATTFSSRHPLLWALESHLRAALTQPVAAPRKES